MVYLIQRSKNQKLNNKSDIYGFVDNSYLDKKYRTDTNHTGIRAKQKAEQDKIEKLQTYDSSLLICQSYFGNVESHGWIS